MRAVRFSPNLCVGILLSSLAAMLMAQPSAAEGTRMMTVLGSIDGTAGGTEREWLTIAGEVEGRAMSSAAWRPYSMANVMEGALAGMSDTQRAQMQKQMEMMSEMMDEGADTPLAQMFGGDGEDQVQLRIMGVDPEAEHILRQGGLTIELPPFSPEDTNILLTGPHEAEISYHKNFGDSTGFYVSSHDVGTPATVAFDQLDIVAGGGFAVGTFEGSLCPIRSLMGSEPSLDGCILVAGRFETELGEEDADNAASRAAN